MAHATPVPDDSLQRLHIDDEVSPAPLAGGASAEPLQAQLSEASPAPVATTANSDDDVSSGADSEGGILSDPEETDAQEERYERRLRMLRRRDGASADKTLNQV